MTKISILLFILLTSLFSKEKTIPQNNLMTVGIELSAGFSNETLSNQTGSKSYNYTINNVKFKVGKDFNFYNEFMQNSRLQLALSYSKLSTGISYKEVSLAYQENMRYWNIYKQNNHQIFPFANLEVGYTAIHNDTLSSKGTSFGADIGLIYAYNSFEYSLALSNEIINWNHPTDGIADYMINTQIALGLNYRFMDEGY